MVTFFFGHVYVLVTPGVALNQSNAGTDHSQMSHAGVVVLNGGSFLQSQVSAAIEFEPDGTG